jgi:hypothetical protein
LDFKGFFFAFLKTNYRSSTSYFICEYIERRGRIMATTTKIDEYDVMYSSNLFPPRIWLKSAGKFIGQLIFKANGAALPVGTMSSGQVNLY